nr:hypothetical protein GCM10020093_065020 [Planobispora longispora]
MVTLTAYASAYWVLVANGFMQNPVGAEVSGGVLRLTDAAAVLGNPTALTAFGHVLSASLVAGAFFVTGVSAYHLRRRTAEREFFRRSLRIGVFTGLPALLAAAAFGGASFVFVQPTKEALFEGDAAEFARLQAEAVTAHGSATGLADHLPPMGLVQAGAILMFVAFVVMLLIAVPSALLALSRRAVLGMRSWHLVLIAAVPLPFAAVLGGWVFREVGRQPWVVYGLLTTEEALSDLSPGTLRFSLTAFAALFALLVAANVWMLARNARRGPVDAPSLLDEPSDTPAERAPAAAF